MDPTELYKVFCNPETPGIFYQEVRKMTPEQIEQYQIFVDCDASGSARVKAMGFLRKQGMILEDSARIKAINAAIMEGKANEQCN